MVRSTPKGFPGAPSLTSFMHFSMNQGDLPDIPRTPSPPALLTAATKGGIATLPMPASIIGYLIPTSSHNWVRIALSSILPPSTPHSGPALGPIQLGVL